MTGTAETEAEELNKIYNLEVLTIPTNKPCQRDNLNDIVYKSEQLKFFAIAEEVVKVHNKGRPVLIGTTSIDKSEFLGTILSKPMFALQILEKRLARFNVLSSQNGVDVPAELKKAFEKPGTLKLSAIEPYLENLKKQCAKKEELKFALDTFLDTLEVLDAIKSGLKFTVLNAKHHEKEAEIIRQAGKPGAITIATNMAGRGTDIVLGGYLSNDPKDPNYEVVDKEAQAKVIASGGLHVIGSERHESRRIDNQLRGRCARQGDPGTSRFFLSLEDNLMRIFGGDKMISIMNMLNADDDTPIEAGIITGAINNSQKKVEGHHFDMRKHVLQYDDVVNTQREVIYRERRKILEGGDIHQNIINMINLQAEGAVYQFLNAEANTDLWFDSSSGASPIQKCFEQLKTIFTEEVTEHMSPMEEFRELGFDALVHQAKEAALKIFTLQENSCGLDILKAAERQIMLHVIDNKWIGHLHAMDALKDGIHLQGYGQKDPLVEYKKEAFNMFDELLFDIKRDTVTLLFHAQIINRTNAPMDGNPEAANSMK
jgi:preprotein translocase subunit SecA